MYLVTFHSVSVCVCVCVYMSTYIKSRCGEEDVRGLGDICSMEAVVIRYVSMVMVLQGHHVSYKGVDRDTKRLQQLSLLRRRRREERSHNFTHTTRRTSCTSTANTQTLQVTTILQKTHTYLEDGIHDAAEGSVVGELCYSEYVKAPLVQILQLLVETHRHGETYVIC